MRLAITNVHHALAAHENTVRAGELALERIAVRAVAALAGANNGGDDTGFEVDATDRMAFGIGDIEAVIGSPRDAFGAIEPCLGGGSTVALVTYFAGTGDVRNALRPRVDAIDGVAFAQHQVEVALRIAGDGARPVERGAGERSSI